MTQEIFWIISAINFIIIAIITIINIIVTIISSNRLRKLNKKVGVDLSVHKELMQAISDFVCSIGYDKVNYPSNMMNNESFQSIIHKNYGEMKQKYVKLILYIEYCFTNNTDFKTKLDSVYKKYCGVFELLSKGVYNRQLYYNLSKKQQNEEWDDLYNTSYEELSKYRAILDDMEIDEMFFESLELFVKAEADYIKTNKI